MKIAKKGLKICKRNSQLQIIEKENYIRQRTAGRIKFKKLTAKK